MARRDANFEDETTQDPSISDGAGGERFVRREADLTEKINGASVHDTDKEYVIEKANDAEN